MILEQPVRAHISGSRSTGNQPNRTTRNHNAGRGRPAAKQARFRERALAVRDAGYVALGIGLDLAAVF